MTYAVCGDPVFYYKRLCDPGRIGTVVNVHDVCNNVKKYDLKVDGTPGHEKGVYEFEIVGKLINDTPILYQGKERIVEEFDANACTIKLKANEGGQVDHIRFSDYDRALR